MSLLQEPEPKANKINKKLWISGLGTFKHFPLKTTSLQRKDDYGLLLPLQFRETVYGQ